MRKGTALWRDVGIGLLVTLGNPKPILFYGALLPTCSMSAQWHGVII
jgi:threonine/homoserine/homoserine lactone efflux protein